MNKKAIIITAIAILTAGAIGVIIYLNTRPKPVSGCDILLTKMLEAKTQDERNFAEKRWTDTCITK
ncbi:hypothetical protein [Phormidium tenue]|jgi:hypothetical protein|uniref:Entry exclusion lipoprotein TrbK n=1 Tax=Phormidium tenue FACHB-1050 TaxID=2692857 RepID=A0ABR8CJ14_9CYAN|nr:hypothetical protein [Phormidium tenue]MBD2319955.1 hypothetical protein [Phormidium tenue FACHB-1050]